MSPEPEAGGAEPETGGTRSRDVPEPGAGVSPEPEAGDPEPEAGMSRSRKPEGPVDGSRDVPERNLWTEAGGPVDGTYYPRTTAVLPRSDLPPLRR